MNLLGRLAILAAAIGSLPVPCLFAQTYPERPIRLIVPNPAGGFIDGVGRIVADRLTANLGKSVVIENRGGASGKIGEDVVLSSPADGYTLLIASVSRPTLMQQVNPGPPDRDILGEFEIVSALGSAPLMMTMTPKLGAKDFPALVQIVKSEPGKHGYGSVGVGTPSPLISKMLSRLLALDISQVPYAGGADALKDMTTGVVVWLIATPGDSLGLINAGLVLPGFVISSKRLPQLPDTPTAAELGYNELRDQAVGLYIMAAKGTPKPILDRLNEAVAAAQEDPALISRLESVAFTQLHGMSLEASRKVAETEVTSWETSIKAAGIR